MKAISRILVITRMNPYSRKTIQYSVSIARTFNAKLHIMHLVSDPVDLMTANTSGLFPEVQYTNYINSQKEAKEQLAKVIKQELRHGIAIHELVNEQNSLEAILQLVRTEKIDLILITAHEEGRIEHTLFGGDNDALIRNMPCSILLVKNEPGIVSW